MLKRTKAQSDRAEDAATKIRKFETVRDAELTRIPTEMNAVAAGMAHHHEKHKKKKSRAVRYARKKMHSLVYGSRAPHNFDKIPLVVRLDSNNYAVRTDARPMEELRATTVAEHEPSISTLLRREPRPSDDPYIPPDRPDDTDVVSNWFNASGGSGYFRNVLLRHELLYNGTTASVAASAVSARSAMAQSSQIHASELVTPWHVSFYLFEPCFPGERHCVNGERCYARMCLPHPSATKKADEVLLAKLKAAGSAVPPSTVNPNPTAGGIILKEFLSQHARMRFLKTGVLPSVHGPCIVCIRALCMYNHYLVELRALNEWSPPHYHNVDVVGGYKRMACIQFTRSGNSSSTPLFIRHFVVNEYMPVMFDPKIVGLLKDETARLAVDPERIKQIRGYAEAGHVLYFCLTRWLSPQAASHGTEPGVMYVPMLSEVAPPPGLHHFGRQDHMAAVSERCSFTRLAEFAADNGGHDVEVMRVLLGPFDNAVEAVSRCLISDDPQHDRLREFVLTHPAWRRYYIPRPYHQYAIYITLFVREGIVDDVRRRSAIDVVNLHTNMRLRFIRLNIIQTIEAASKRVSLCETRCEAELSTDPTSPDAAAALAELDHARSLLASAKADLEAAPVLPIELNPPAQTTLQTAIMNRVAAKDRAVLILDSQPPSQKRPRMLASAAAKKRASRHRTFRYINDTLNEFGAIHHSQTPLRRWFVAAVASSQPVDDASLTGSTDIISAQNVAIALGDMNPDLLVLPQTVTPTPRRVRYVAPIPPIPDPPVAMIVYPTHREAILSWLDSNGCCDGRVSRNTPILTALRILNAIKAPHDSGDHPQHRPDPPVFQKLTVADFLLEFYKTVWVVTNSRVDRVLYTVAKCGKLVLPEWLTAKTPDTPPGCNITPSDTIAFATSLVVRTMLADMMCAQAVSSQQHSIAFRIQAFAWTHSDLALAINWRGKYPTPDAKLTAMSTKTSLSIAEHAYPSDWRCYSSNELAPLGELLSYCGIFDYSGQANPYSPTHALSKLLPRTCQIRQTTSVTTNTCLTSRKYSHFIATALKMTLCGFYPHARVRPSFKECLTASNVVRDIIRELYSRVDGKEAYDDHVLHNKSKKTIKSITDMFTTSGGTSDDAVLASVSTVDILADTAAVLSATLSGNVTSPYIEVASAARKVIVTAFTHEIYRRTASRSAPLPTRAFFTPDKVFAAIDAEAISSMERPLPRDEDVVSRVAVVVADKLFRNFSRAYIFRSTVLDHIKRDKPLPTAYRDIIWKLADALKHPSIAVPSYTNHPDVITVLAPAIIDAFDTLSERGGIRGNGPLSINAAFNDARSFVRSAAATMRLDPDVVLPSNFAFVDKLTSDPKVAVAVGDDATRAAVKAALRASIILTLKKRNEDIKTLSAVQIVEISSKASEDAITTLGRVIACGLPHVLLTSIAAFSQSIHAVAPTVSSTLARIKNVSATGVAKLIPPAAAQPFVDVLNWFATRKARRKSAASVLSEPDAPQKIADVNHVLAKLDKYISWRSNNPPLVVTGSAATEQQSLPPFFSYSAKSSDAPVDVTTHPPLATLYAAGATSFAIVNKLLASATAVFDMADMYKNALSDYRASLNGAKAYEVSYSRIADKEEFVSANSTLLKYVVREALVHALALNPAMTMAFQTRGKWFVDFTDSVCAMCDHIRMQKHTIPPDPELAAAAITFSKKKWKYRVFKLYKHNEPTRFTHALAKIEKTLRARGYCLTPRNPDTLRACFMWEYILYMFAAHNNAFTPTTTTADQDLEALWHFGLREHGLGVVARMHRAYALFGGKTVLTHIAKSLRPAEFELVSIYYDMLKKASAIRMTPLCSRAWTESAYAALCIRQNIADNEPIPRELTHLYVCDRCHLVVTQMAPNTIRPANTSSCFGAASDAMNRIVCANRRHIGRKRTTLLSAVVADLGTTEVSEACDVVDDIITGVGETVITTKPPNQSPDLAVVAATTTTTTTTTASPKKKTRRTANQRHYILPPCAFDWPAPCSETRTRTIFNAGTVVEFDTKYSAKSERSAIAKLPSIITPCCGHFTRVSRENTGETGLYECMACAQRRKAYKRQIPTCAACNRPVQVSQEVLDSYVMAGFTYAPCVSDRVRLSVQDRFSETINRNSSFERAVRVGPRLPIVSANIALVYDDRVTSSILFVDLCPKCAECPAVKSGRWPVALSTILKYAITRQRSDEMRLINSQREYTTTHGTDRSKRQPRKFFSSAKQSVQPEDDTLAETLL